MTLDPLQMRRARHLTLLSAIFGFALLSAVQTGFRLDLAAQGGPRALLWLVRNFVPDAGGWTRLPSILAKLRETVFLAIASTTTASLCAFVFAVFASQKMHLGKPLGGIALALASLSRNIPVAAWAMVLLFSFGQNILAGFFALFLNTFGFLTRAFREVIDESSGDTIECQRALGASWPQIVCQGVLPCALPQVLSWTLFMIETNIRTATLVGLLTGTGVGFLFMLYYRAMNYGAASLVVLAIAIAVLLIEAVSTTLRRRML